MALSLSDLAGIMEGLLPSPGDLRELAEELADFRIEAAVNERDACRAVDAATGQPCCLWAGHHEEGWSEHLDAGRWWRGARPWAGSTATTS